MYVLYLNFDYRFLLNQWIKRFKTYFQWGGVQKKEVVCSSIRPKETRLNFFSFILHLNKCSNKDKEKHFWYFQMSANCFDNLVILIWASLPNHMTQPIMTELLKGKLNQHFCWNHIFFIKSTLTLIRLYYAEKSKAWQICPATAGELWLDSCCLWVGFSERFT